MDNSKKITQYFSKWRDCWVFFRDRNGNKYLPNKAELKELRKFKYKLR